MKNRYMYNQLMKKGIYVNGVLLSTTFKHRMPASIL